MFINSRQYNPRRIVLGLLVLLLLNEPASAESRAEHCVDIGATQYFDSMATCATSVLPSQGKNQYGPEQLSDKNGAWCEGSNGDGLHEEIRFYFSVSSSPRRFYIRNGYVKSSSSYSGNGRVAVLRMSDHAGHVKDVVLKDTPDEQTIDVPWESDDVIWIQFEIRKVYRGSKYSDTCISQFTPDFEGE